MGNLAINPDTFPHMGEVRPFAREMARRAHRREFMGPPEPERTPATREPKPRKGLHPILLMGPLAGAGADAFTTDRFFDAVRAADARPEYEVTGREENPLLRGIAENDAALYAIKGGVGLGISGIAELLARRGHRNLGKGVAIAGTVLPMALAVRNMAQTDAIRKATP